MTQPKKAPTKKVPKIDPDRADAAVEVLQVAPVITPERAQELVREGAEAARAYRQRVARMWAISKDARQTRAR